jgi:hypothetical protein
LRRHLTSLLPRKDEWTAPLQQLQECYNINVDEDDDPRDVNILETKGQRDIEGTGIELPFVGQPIKIKKVNIGTEKTPKLAKPIKQRPYRLNPKYK